FCGRACSRIERRDASETKPTLPTYGSRTPARGICRARNIRLKHFGLRLARYASGRTTQIVHTITESAHFSARSMRRENQAGSAARWWADGRLSQEHQSENSGVRHRQPPSAGALYGSEPST